MSRQADASMDAVERASEKFEKELKKVETLLTGGIPITDIETFKHHAHIFFNFGYAVGRHDKKEENDEMSTLRNGL